jgi:hypothetical protein
LWIYLYFRNMEQGSKMFSRYMVKMRLFRSGVGGESSVDLDQIFRQA